MPDLAGIAELQLCSQRLCSLQRCLGAIGIAGKVTDLALLAQELGVLFGGGLDLGLTRLE